MQYIIAIGIFQALVVGAILWKKKLWSGANSLLFLMVVCIASHLAIKFVIYNFIGDIHIRQQMNTFIGYCYGPLLYLYALKVTDDRFIPPSKWYVFLPFVFGAIAYFTTAGVLFISDFTDYRLLKWYNDISSVTMVASRLCFVFLTLHVSKKYIGVEKAREKQMIERLAYFFIAMMIFYVSFVISKYMFHMVNLLVFRSIIYAIETCVLLLIGYYSIFQEHNNVIISAAAEAVVGEIIGKKASLSAERKKEILDILESHLRQYKSFTDSNLSLDKLALATGINKYHISETLNSYAQRSFYQYINEYRIKYAIDLMGRLHQDDVPINVLSLAYDAGFKAKSSFNRYFKDITGFTPTEHMKSLS